MLRNETLHIKIVKNKLVNTLESGMITEPNDQLNLINDALKDINLIKDNPMSSSIFKYFEDQEKLEKQIETKNKDLQKDMDEYTDNAKEIYETIKKL